MDRTRRLLRFLPAALLAALAALSAWRMLQDVDHDLFWQLKDGERVVVERVLPLEDDYSFTETGAPLPATEWLSESISFVLFRAGGYGLLVLFNALLFLLTFSCLYFLVRRRLPELESLALVCLTAFGFASFCGARAQNWTFLFVSVFLLAAARWEEGDWRMPWLMAALLLPWANMHGGFMLGLAILGMVCAAQVWRSRRPSDFAPLAAGALACCAHPNGWRALAYPVWFMASPPPSRGLIYEWRPVDFREVTSAPYALILALLLWVGLRRTEGAFPWSSLALVLAVLALRGRKLLPEFCLAAAAVLAPAFAARRGKARAVLLAAGLLSFGWLGWIAASNPRSAGLDCERYFPGGAVEALARLPEGTKVFNNYAWGGYLIYKLYPSRRVFIDGRLEPYWDLLGGDYRVIIDARPGWRELLKKYGIGAALLRPTDPLRKELAQDPEWRIAYSDARSVVFAR